jgi:hypothetical protein
VTNTTTVCLIAKNEAPYLIEWIAYYRILGFDTITIYDNNSTDLSATILKKLAEAELITYTHWPLGSIASPQITAYKDALQRVKTDWILFADTDEFLVLHNHRTVGEFLDEIVSDPDITSISVNWRIFGDAFLSAYDDRPMMERFTWASEANFPVNKHLKSFSRVGTVIDPIHMHICGTTGQKIHANGQPLEMENWGLSKDLVFEVAQMNHYYSKTFEEYQTKIARGSADCSEENKLKYEWYHNEAFHGHNRNDCEDRSVLKRFAETKNEMKRLRAIVEK